MGGNSSKRRHEPRPRTRSRNQFQTRQSINRHSQSFEHTTHQVQPRKNTDSRKRNSKSFHSLESVHERNLAFGSQNLPQDSTDEVQIRKKRNSDHEILSKNIRKSKEDLKISSNLNLKNQSREQPPGPSYSDKYYQKIQHEETVAKKDNEILESDSVSTAKSRQEISSYDSLSEILRLIEEIKSFWGPSNKIPHLLEKVETSIIFLQNHSAYDHDQSFKEVIKDLNSARRLLEDRVPMIEAYENDVTAPKLEVKESRMGEIAGISLRACELVGQMSLLESNQQLDRGNILNLLQQFTKCQTDLDAMKILEEDKRSFFAARSIIIVCNDYINKLNYSKATQL